MGLGLRVGAVMHVAAFAARAFMPSARIAATVQVAHMFPVGHLGSGGTAADVYVLVVFVKAPSTRERGREGGRRRDDERWRGVRGSVQLRVEWRAVERELVERSGYGSGSEQEG